MVYSAWAIVEFLGIVHWAVYALVGAILAFAVGYRSSPIILSRLVAWRAAPADVRTVFQLAAGVVTAAILVRVVVPKDAGWFGQLGDYFNPPLAVVSLVILARAIGLQKRDLEETRRTLQVARRQLRDARRSQLLLDTPWVLVGKLSLIEQSQVLAELLCVGTGPAINVVVSLWGHENLTGAVADLTVTKALLAAGSVTCVRFPNTSMGASLCAVSGETIRALIEWQNAQGVLLRYEVRLQPASHGGWETSGPLVTHRPLYRRGRSEIPGARV